jgi:hypothetical protein
MKMNAGAGDRVFRIILGLVLVAAGIIFENYWGAIGLVPLLTGIIGWCPAYLPFGLSTCSIRTGASTETSTSNSEA